MIEFLCDVFGLSDKPAASAPNRRVVAGMHVKDVAQILLSATELVNERNALHSENERLRGIIATTQAQDTPKATAKED